MGRIGKFFKGGAKIAKKVLEEGMPLFLSLFINPSLATTL
jgi:hypothetical protein